MKQTYTIVFLFVFSLSLLGQERTITGVVTDIDNLSVPGASVLVKGTTVGTITDMDGRYSIAANTGDVLQFSFLGYAEEERAIGLENVIDVVLTTEAQQLEQVVVTALGFKEKRDKMSSTFSKIKAEDVLHRGENKIIDGISGKTSGVRISGSSGDPGAGANIQIRGQNTITGTSQPLIIVDGVPLNNDWLRGSGSESDAGVSQQSRLNDLNPDDIESFQIYKGASAGALYGTRAMNGAIVITTKRGKKGKVKVSYSTALSIDQIARKHPLQNSYGQGTNGNYGATSAFSWGDKISDRTGGADEVIREGQFFYSTVTGDTIYPISTKNATAVYRDENFDKVFQNGSTFDNKLSISGGGDKGTFYISASHANQKGIIKESYLKKTNFSVATEQYLTNKLTANVKVNYINNASNRIQQGSNTAGIYLGLLRTPPDFDISAYKGDYHSSSGAVTQQRHRSYRRYLANSDNPIYNNPLWTINEQENLSKVNRFIGTGELSYAFTDNFSMILRGGGDMYVDSRVYFFPYYTASSFRRYGLLRDETYHNQEYNLDILGNLRMALSEKINGNLILGFGANDRNRKRLYQEADNFLANFRGLYDPNELSKKENISSTVGKTLRRNIRFYGTANFDYLEQLFLTVGGAYEKHSSLSDPFFYPSLEAGWVFSKTITSPEWFTFGKLRLAYGQVGNVPLPHRDETIFEVGSFSTFSDNITLEDFGGGYQLDERFGNKDLKPEIKSEFEYGIDLRFFRNRVTLSTSFYQNTITDALLDIALTPSLGYDEIYGNGADIENNGVEIEATYDFLKLKDWRSGINLNFSKNKNLVTRIEGGGVVNLTPGSSVQSVAIEGHAIGVFSTQGALRDDDGNLVLTEFGFPQVDLSGNQIVGDPNPDWRGGLGFYAGYKNIRFDILFETSQGNDFSERTRFITSYFGTHEDVSKEVTLSKDLYNYDGDLIPAGTVVRGNIENYGGGDVLLDESFYRSLHGFGDGKLNEFAVSDGSWTRIREVSLSYNLNGEKFRNATGLGGIEFSVSGRNVALWTKEVVGIDPDINQFGVGQGQGLDYFTNPSTRTFIFGIKATY